MTKKMVDILKEKGFGRAAEHFGRTTQYDFVTFETLKGKGSSMVSVLAGSGVQLGATLMLASKSLSRFVPYVGWALLAYDALSALFSDANNPASEIKFTQGPAAALANQAIAGANEKQLLLVNSLIYGSVRQHPENTGSDASDFVLGKVFYSMNEGGWMSVQESGSPVSAKATSSYPVVQALAPLRESVLSGTISGLVGRT